MNGNQPDGREGGAGGGAGGDADGHSDSNEGEWTAALAELEEYALASDMGSDSEDEVDLMLMAALLGGDAAQVEIVGAEEDDEESDGAEGADTSFLPADLFSEILGSNCHQPEVAGLPSARALQEALLQSLTVGHKHTTTGSSTSGVAASSTSAGDASDAADADLAAAISMSLSPLPAPPAPIVAPASSSAAVDMAMPMTPLAAVAALHSALPASAPPAPLVLSPTSADAVSTQRMWLQPPAAAARRTAAPSPTSMLLQAREPVVPTDAELAGSGSIGGGVGGGSGSSSALIGVSGYEPFVSDATLEAVRGKGKKAERQAREAAVAAAVQAVVQHTAAAAAGLPSVHCKLIPRARLQSDGGVAAAVSDDAYRALAALHGMPVPPVSSAAAAAASAHSSGSAAHVRTWSLADDAASLASTAASGPAHLRGRSLSEGLDAERAHHSSSGAGAGAAGGRKRPRDDSGSSSGRDTAGAGSTDVGSSGTGNSAEPPAAKRRTQRMSLSVAAHPTPLDARTGLPRRATLPLLVEAEEGAAASGEGGHRQHRVDSLLWANADGAADLLDLFDRTTAAAASATLVRS